MIKSKQEGFSFYGTSVTPIPGVLHYVEEVKVTMIRETPTLRGKMDAPELAYQFWRETVRESPWFNEEKEQLIVLLLDTRYNLVAYNLVSMGSLNESIAHPRDIFRPAIVASAYAIIVMHNHPSGDPSPSQSDHSLTRRLQEAGELLQIKLLDHIVAGEHAPGRQPFFSFKEAGVL